MQKLKQIKSGVKQAIMVSGCNDSNQLSKKQFLNHILELSLDISSLLSYSIYYDHSVLITNSGILMGRGQNTDGRISSSLMKKKICQFTKFSITDSSGHQLVPISAVCTSSGTLYMFSKDNSSGRHLVLCDKEIKGGDPVFLDIGNQHPVALFGGYYHGAAITSEGEIIFVNCHSVKNSPESQISSVSLPNNEKASSIACCIDSLIALSTNGRIFSSTFGYESNALNFSIVEELADEEIVCISGTYEHYLAVSKDGHVFVLGCNKFGQLGVSQQTKSVSLFTEISSLRGCNINEVYAGCSHSLFKTQEGKILSCGANEYGELLISKNLKGNIYSPTETTIIAGSTFCIAGGWLSTVFIGRDPPQNIPNRRIDK